MEEEKIKEAFFKVKKDIFNLQSQIQSFSRQIEELKRTLSVEVRQTDISKNQTDKQKTQTAPYEAKGSRSQNLGSSIGNEGVQTDRQTNQQTDRQTKEFAQYERDPLKEIDKVTEVLSSLDTLKKDLRSQFKKLTPQEMKVFSTIYRLTDQGLVVDYSLVAEKTSLSESSIRDYIQKIIKKGIPLDKNKENNKRITLSIPLNFKQIASLSTITALREI